jgi:PAS domain S-box-containing protein
MRTTTWSGRVVLLTLMITCQWSWAAGVPKRVLILDSYSRDMAATSAIISVLRTELARRSPDPIDLHEVSLEMARFTDFSREDPLVNFLEARFAERQPDLLVSVGGAALQFLARHRQQIFASTPAMIAGVADQIVLTSEIPANTAVVSFPLDLSGVVEGILRVLPDTENIAVVFGTSPIERFWQEECRGAFVAFADQVGFTYLNHLPLEGIRAHAASLAPKSAIFFGLLMVDAAGIPYDTEEALKEIIEDAKAPVFTVFESFFGLGTVGGHLIQERDTGMRAADTALRLLAGQPVADIDVPSQPPAIPVYDWRALQRWGISEKRLPPGSLVRFRHPSFWERYRWHVLAAGGLMLLQGLFIAGLMVQRLRRSQAEKHLAASEKRLRLITNALPALIAYVDSNQCYRFNNNAYTEWFGISPEQALGRSIREVVGEPMYRRVSPYVERALAGEHVRFTEDIDMGAGRQVCIEAIYVPDTDEQGRVCGIYILALDVSERNRAQLESKQLQEELIHAGRISTMGELAGALAHEINQPLSAMMSNAQAARRYLSAPQPDTPEVQEILADIVADAERAGGVINRLRALLKNAQTEWQALDLNFILREVEALLHSDAMIRGIQVDLELDPRLPSIRGDRIQLQQVALNLMLNAIEAMEDRPRGERRLLVSTVLKDAEIITAVSDSGDGIPLGGIDKVFKPFYTTKPQGLGMGLSISRSIVRAHQGRLWVESKPEGGATFYFSLPLTTAEQIA